MVKVHGPLMSMEARGKIGQRLVFSKRGSGQQARFQKAQKDVVTSLRTAQRDYYKDSVLIWNHLSVSEKLFYENLSKGKKYTAYNAFVKRRKLLWSYLNNVSSVGSIGNTATLGWMNLGFFSMEFEIINGMTQNVKLPFANATGLNNHGFWFVVTTSNMNFVWAHGTTPQFLITNIFASFVVGRKYKIRVRGDGAKIYYTTFNEDGTINKTNEPTGLTCPFKPYATTNNPLKVNFPTYLFKGHLRNFKIYRDFNGTIPFMFLPMCDSGNVLKDVVGGLVGTYTDISVVER